MINTSAEVSDNCIISISLSDNGHETARGCDYVSHHNKATPGIKKAKILATSTC